MQGGDYAKFKHAAVLEITIVLYSQEICMSVQIFPLVGHFTNWTGHNLLTIMGCPRGSMYAFAS